MFDSSMSDEVSEVPSDATQAEEGLMTHQRVGGILGGVVAPHVDLPSEAAIDTSLGNPSTFG